ncbi:FliM/FliN family flagellar motor switch protein [Romboutsia sp.]|nr:FliM/FliN family flagellar motor switch protein [Romboutsia sp.]HSQ89326.1 FliM/FliN family flagellar motor switch protein [Romboutsia sp.]
MSGKFERVLDISLNVKVILGRTKMSVKDVFELPKGSLIKAKT